MTSPRVLVIGAEGIAGRALMREIPSASGTTRGASSEDRRIIPDIDVTSCTDLMRVFDRADPEVVINCAGIVKSECDKHAPRHIENVNAVAPHDIARLVSIGCRVIHLSTDCVYDGSHGGRIEAETTDATDLYGQTKARGELKGYHHCVTLRTSFIGRDLRYRRGLVEWLRTQGEEIAGYTNALWSGLSAAELARVISRVVIPMPLLSGLYHVSGPVISKADLLHTLIWTHQMSRWVRRIDEPRIDRTLDGSRFREATGYVAPSWDHMAKEMAQIDLENEELP